MKKTVSIDSSNWKLDIKKTKITAINNGHKFIIYKNGSFEYVGEAHKVLPNKVRQTLLDILHKNN